jgi:hypothetical protein
MYFPLVRKGRNYSFSHICPHPPRSYGFPFHAYPYDFWRYEIEDLQRIFSDLEIIKLVRDHEDLGVFLKARKPFDYNPNDLQGIALYSMILGRKTTSIPTLQEMSLSSKTKLLIHKVVGLTRSMVGRSLSIR